MIYTKKKKNDLMRSDIRLLNFVNMYNGIPRKPLHYDAYIHIFQRRKPSYNVKQDYREALGCVFSHLPSKLSTFALLNTSKSSYLVIILSKINTRLSSWRLRALWTAGCMKLILAFGHCEFGQFGVCNPKYCSSSRKTTPNAKEAETARAQSP